MPAATCFPNQMNTWLPLSRIAAESAIGIDHGRFPFVIKILDSSGSTASYHMCHVLCIL